MGEGLFSIATLLLFSPFMGLRVSLSSRVFLLLCTALCVPPRSSDSILEYALPFIAGDCNYILVFDLAPGDPLEKY